MSWSGAKVAKNTGTQTLNPETKASLLKFSLPLQWKGVMGLKMGIVGQPGWLSGLAPPSAQGLIQSHVGLPVWSLRLPLPVSLPLCLSLSHE